MRVNTVGFIKTRAELYKAFGFSLQGGVEVWAEVNTKGFIEPKGSRAEREGKEGWAEREGKGVVYAYEADEVKKK